VEERAAPERRRVSDVERRLEKQREKAARDLARWSRGARTPMMQQLSAAMPLTQEMMVSSDWSKAEAIHFLVLHRARHIRLYGASLIMSQRSLALVVTAVREHFKGVKDFACFMYWAWEREEVRVAQLRTNDVPLSQGFPIKKLVSDDLISGYRTHLADERL